MNTGLLPHITATTTKPQVFEMLEKYIAQMGFTIADKDFSRPWGGFFVLEEKDAPAFIQTYFPGYTLEELMVGDKLSPKFLVVLPDARLSWQYHHRREEIWRVLINQVKVAISLTDNEVEPHIYSEGEIIKLSRGERHRLIGFGCIGVVAEIWQHSDPNAPSDESDIIRLQDDYGRNSG